MNPDDPYPEPNRADELSDYEILLVALGLAFLGFAIYFAHVGAHLYSVVTLSFILIVLFIGWLTYNPATGYGR